MGSKDLWCAAIAVLQVACVLTLFVSLLLFIILSIRIGNGFEYAIVSVLIGQACTTESIMHQFTYGNSIAHSFSLVP
jgi:hypothetical protein